MATSVTASFEVTTWDEHEYDRHAGAGKVTRAKVTKTYAGDVDGTSVTQSLMAYADDGTAAFVGMERIVGTIAGHDGTLVLQHVGAFQDGAATADLTVVGGSSTGDFAGATGGGTFVADPSGRITLDVTLG